MLKTYKEMEFNGAWITAFFRKRWVTERDVAIIEELRQMIYGLSWEESLAVLQGYKRLDGTVKGCMLLDDSTLEIDGEELRWDFINDE